MDQNDVLESLFDARSALTDAIVELSPSNDSERDQLNELVRQRDTVNASIRAVIDSEFRKVANDPKLADAVADLRARTKELASLAKTIGNIGQAVTIVNQVVQVAITIGSIVIAL
jgi:hypothetical protein